MLRTIRIPREVQSLYKTFPLAAQLICVNLSAVFLLFAYPYADLWGFAWVALVPLLAALEKKKTVVAFALSYLCGVIFFTGIMYWLVHVTLLGAFLMILYLALYFGAFGVIAAYLSGRGIVKKMVILPSAWVILEFFRDRFLTGFGWACLGHSQYKALMIIQIADLTGVFGISFLLVMVNVYIKEVLLARLTGRQDNTQENRAATALVLMCVLPSLLYGANQLFKNEEPKGEIKIAVIQPNVPQEIKWFRSVWPKTMDEILELTASVVDDKPDLIIWPETSFPGYMWESQELYEKVKQRVSEMGIPVLFGAVDKPADDYYNSAILLSGAGREVKRYNKLHLVPFGEYIPLRGNFPILADIVPIADFTPGGEATLFAVPVNGELRNNDGYFFSVLICFEDTIARVTRRFAREGAHLLVNITNDAWFMDSSAPFLHMQSAVFRTVENRKDMVRAANTGVSCFIDRKGRITKTLEGPRGKKTFVAGTLTGYAQLNAGETFYNRWGDIFVVLCTAASAALLIFRKD